MKTLLRSSICLFFTLQLQAQAPAVQWAYGIRCVTVPTPVAIATDSNGNVYSAGNTTGALIFPTPTNSIVYFTSCGIGCIDNTEFYISKLNAAGTFDWGGIILSEHSICNDMVSDPSGNLYFTGIFSGETEFDISGASNTTLSTTQGASAAFVLKLNSNSTLVWVKQIGDGIQSGPTGQTIVTDAAGNVYVAGKFSGLMDFDPSAATYTLNATGTDGFVLKLDAAGNFVWVRQLEAVQVKDIELDGLGNIYTGGLFAGTVDFDPGAGVSSLSSYGLNDGFISKLTGNGNFVWARQLGGSGNDSISSLKVDCEGNICSTGNFTGDFFGNPASAVSSFSTSGQSDIFISRLDASGNYIWAKQIGGSSSELASSLAVDGAENIYLTGSFGGGGPTGATCDFDPGLSVNTLTSAGATDAFYCRLNAGGDGDWAYSAGSIAPEAGCAITADQGYNVYVAGQSNYTISLNLNPPSAASTLTHTSVFILKLSQPDPTIPFNTTPSGPGGSILCANSSATLSASGSGTLNWYTSNTSAIPVGTGPVFATPVLTANATFYVESAACGQTFTLVPVSVTVNPLPVITAAPAQSVVCSGQPATLTASGGSTYVWSNGMNTPSITVTVTTTSTYTVTGTDLNSCSGSTTVVVSASPCTGIDGYDPSVSLSVFPNPATSEFFINSDEQLTLTIFNDVGAVVKTVVKNGTEKRIAVNDLGPGVYFISTGKLCKPQKLIILNQ